MIWALGIGILSTMLSVILAFTDPTRFFQSYLFSYLVWIDLPLGSLTLLMIYHLTGGTWGASTRRILEAACGTIDLMIVLFLPIVFGLSKIYPWLAPGALDNPKIAHKASYLNASAFSLRAALYLLIWFLLSHGLIDWSKTHVRRLSAGGLVIYALSASFASFDWQMSLEPEWYSTIYGMIYCAGQALSAFAFAVLAFVIIAQKTQLSALFPNKTKRDLGRLLLAFVMVWAYLAFVQFLVVWMGNLPEEATWFHHRTRGGWQMFAVFLIAMQFGLPFGALLFRTAKDHLRVLSLIAGLIFFTRIVDHYWTVMPSFYPERISLQWQDLITFLAVGGLWMGLFLYRLRRKPLFATQDADWPLESSAEVNIHV